VIIGVVDEGGGGGGIVGEAPESFDDEEVGDDKSDEVNEEAELVAPSLAAIITVFIADTTVDEPTADVLQEGGDVLLFFNLLVILLPSLQPLTFKPLLAIVDEDFVFELVDDELDEAVDEQDEAEVSFCVEDKQFEAPLETAVALFVIMLVLFF
jgi:hypothetical protein